MDYVFLAYSGSPPGSYSQETPPRRPYEKSVGPPVLPPHLLEVILNKDVDLNVSFILAINTAFTELPTAMKKM